MDTRPVEDCIEVLGHRVLIEPVFEEEATEWGFIMDTGGDDFKRQKASAHMGRIISKGPNAWLAFDGGESWAEVGDLVYFAKYGGKFITYNDKEYVIVNDEDIQLRILVEEKTDG
jgi:co-chaperonin GroES (HSP10)